MTVRGLLVSVMVIMLASHNVGATSAVGLAESLSLSEEDLGLNGVAIDSDELRQWSTDRKDTFGS